MQFILTYHFNKRRTAAYIRELMFHKCMEIQEMIVRYNFLYKSVILKLLHKFSLRRKKNELRGKNKRKILSAAASSMCKLLPLPAQLTHYYLYLNCVVLYKDEKHSTKN